MHYQCTKCNKTYPTDKTIYLCPECGQNWNAGSPLEGVLTTVFDYDYIGKNFDINNPDWSLFSAVDPKYFPAYPVGNTPFSKVNRLGSELGFDNLWVKFDGLNPSGSLKDRASFLIVAEANRLGIDDIVTASTGNAASALAAVCASAGKKAIIFAPASAPQAKLVQMEQYGATLNKVDGTYDDAFALSIEYSKKHSGLNRNTAYHPLTIEGKKNAALEIFAQNNYKAPDAILIPVGDGVILSGIYKGFYDLLQAGLIDKLPKLICVQAESSDAIHQYLNTGIYQNAKNPTTCADSISVSAPSNAHMAKMAIEKSGGFSILVNDEEILAGQHLLAKTTGIFAEPAASVGVMALAKIRKQNLLDKNEQVVLLVTGHGLKDIATAAKFIENQNKSA